MACGRFLTIRGLDRLLKIDLIELALRMAGPLVLDNCFLVDHY
jgi:hypothetical protein